MKTIATAAVLMMLTAPTWADDPENRTNDPADSKKRIVLSETEMDGVTAGYEEWIELISVNVTTTRNSTSTYPGFKAGKALKDAVN